MTTTLAQLSKKLRFAAEALDDLLGVDRPTKLETPDVARKIHAALDQRVKQRRKKHWTQRPENHAKLMKMVKASASKRAKTMKAAASKPWNGATSHGRVQ